LWPKIVVLDDFCGIRNAQKIDLGQGLAPDPTCGVYATPPTLLASGAALSFGSLRLTAP